MLRFALVLPISPKISHQGVCFFRLWVLKRNANINRSANYGTTNESASAGFFVSPKTKSRPGYTPSRPENSEITPFAIDFRALFDTIRVRISHMRKGAAGYGRCILSSANRVTSTFADVAYSKPPRNRGLFSFAVVDNLPQSIRICKTNMNTKQNIVENFKKQSPTVVRFACTMMGVFCYLQIETNCPYQLLSLAARAEDDFVQLVRRGSVRSSSGVIAVF